MTWKHKEYGTVNIFSLKKSIKGCRWGLFKEDMKDSDEPIKLFKNATEVFKEIEVFRIQENGIPNELFFDDMWRVINA